MDRAMFFLTRSTGIIATLLAIAALLWGFLFSSRSTGKRLRPNWWLDLHNWLGGLTLVFVVVHIVVSMLDAGSGIGFLQAFVPGTAKEQPWAITWGVVATYGFVAVVFTSWPSRMKHRLWWRVIHLTSIAATGLAILHGFQVGSDAPSSWFQTAMFGAVAIGVAGLVARLRSLRPHRDVDSDSQRTHSRLSRRPEPTMAESDHEQ